jgi:membrane protein implicated in regulation of membrane protease activity
MEFWHWLALGFVLMSIELAAPSFFFMWLGVSALAVGGLLYLIPDMPFEAQGGIFTVAGVLSFYLSRKYFKARQQNMAPNTLNKRGAGLIGEVVTLETAIENGRGKARVGDTLWSVEGPDLPAESRVKIVGAEGTTLKVEAV